MKQFSPSDSPGPAEPKTATDLVREARKDIENLKPAQVFRELQEHKAILIDIREADEYNQARIAGATLAPRGMLEFYADPTLPYHKPEFRKDARIILYCASSGRSALAVKTLKTMGYTNVAHMDGGIKAWQADGLPVEE